MDFYREIPSRSTRRSTGTRARQRKRQKYSIDITAGENELRCRAATDLPTGQGDYFVRVRVGGIKFETIRKTVPLRRRTPPTIQFVEQAPTSALRLSRRVGEFDQRMLDILNSSRLDRQRGTHWIQSAVNRDRRRACVLNILAKLAILTGARTPLLNHVRSIFLADSDRIYISAAPALLDSVQACNEMEGESHIHKTHERLVRRLPRGARASDYRLQGFREASNPSLQIVVARPQNGVSDDTHYADVDIDLGNPRLDIRGFLIHVGEVLHADKTNHMNLRRALGESACRRLPLLQRSAT